MLIYVFPPHYQLVYINFDISSFSLISYFSKEQVLQSDFTNNIMRKILFCISKEAVLPCKTASFTVQKNGYCNVLIDNRLCDR